MPTFFLLKSEAFQVFVPVQSSFQVWKDVKQSRDTTTLPGKRKVVFGFGCSTSRVIPSDALPWCRFMEVFFWDLWYNRKICWQKVMSSFFLQTSIFFSWIILFSEILFIQSVFFWVAFLWGKFLSRSKNIGVAHFPMKTAWGLGKGRQDSPWSCGQLAEFLAASWDGKQRLWDP